jgi:ATP-binding protein involved in chromosome partitioning
LTFTPKRVTVDDTRANVVDAFARSHCEGRGGMRPEMRRALARLAARRGFASRAGVPGPGTPAPPGGFKHPPLPASLAGTKRVVAVASGKGGVGKSTTAVNLACAAASALGLRVGLLDADVHGPSIPTLMNLRHSGSPALEGDAMLPMENHGVRCMSVGLLIPDGGAAVWRGPMVMGALGKMIRDTKWGALDVLFVDMPPGSGDAHISISQSLPLSGAVIVSTPQQLALADVKRGVDAYAKVNAPILGFVENMAYMEVLPAEEVRTEGEETRKEKEARRVYVFGEGGVRRMAETTGAELLGEVPLDPNVVTTSDEGNPVAVSDPTSAAARAYVKMAKRIVEKAKPFET